MNFSVVMGKQRKGGVNNTFFQEMTQFIATKHSADYKGASPFNPIPRARLCSKIVSRKISYASEGSFFPFPSVSSAFLPLHE